MKMKTMFLRTLLLIAALLVLAPWPARPAETTGVRQALLEAPGVRSLYVVDRTHSFVIADRDADLERGPYRVLGTYEGADKAGPRGLMIEHGDEPLLQTEPHRAPSLEALLKGPLTLTREPLTQAEGGVSSLDVFETATQTCISRGGPVRYVIPKRYGRYKRLTEVEGLEAFRYLLLHGREGAWFVVCDGRGDARFQLMKNYDLVNDGREVVEYKDGVALEGVNYVRNEAAEARRLAELQKKREAMRGSTLEDTAREIAYLRTGFVKNLRGRRYYGTYRGRDRSGRCATVSLRSTDRENGQRVTLVRDYRVCGRDVTVTAYSESADPAPAARLVYTRGAGLRLARRRH